MATGTLIFPLLGFTQDETNPPATLFSNNRPKLAFDDTTDEIIYVTFRMPSDYASAPVLKVQFSAAGASGNVVIGCEVMAVTITDFQNMDSDSYAAINTVTSPVSVTPGEPEEASLSLVNNGSLAAGDYVAFRVRRNASNVSDTAVGDLFFWAISLEYTTA